jgi:Flp pilus assembly protein TadG
LSRRRTTLSSRRQRSRGQGLVEFALVFPILMLLLIAVFDMGRLVFAYNDITNAARSGARVAIVDQTAGVAQNATIKQATSLGLKPADVIVDYLKADLSAPCATPKQLGCVAHIKVNYAWRAITPIIGSIVGPITVTAETRMQIERIYP